MTCKTCNGARMVPSWTLCGELDAEECPDCHETGVLSDDEIIKMFYPLDGATKNQRHVAISIGRAISAKALRIASRWMDEHGVERGAIVNRMLADMTLKGAAVRDLR